MPHLNKEKIFCAIDNPSHSGPCIPLQDEDGAEVVAESSDGVAKRFSAHLGPSEVEDLTRYLQGAWLQHGTYSILATGFTLTLSRDDTGAVVFQLIERQL